MPFSVSDFERGFIIALKHIGFSYKKIKEMLEETD